jgi:hypothetical protein
MGGGVNRVIDFSALLPPRSFLFIRREKERQKDILAGRPYKDKKSKPMRSTSKK